MTFAALINQQSVKKERERELPLGGSASYNGFVVLGNPMIPARCRCANWSRRHVATAAAEILLLAGPPREPRWDKINFRCATAMLKKRSQREIDAGGGTRAPVSCLIRCALARQRTPRCRRRHRMCSRSLRSFFSYRCRFSLILSLLPRIFRSFNLANRLARAVNARARARLVEKAIDTKYVGGN